MPLLSTGLGRHAQLPRNSCFFCVSAKSWAVFSFFFFFKQLYMDLYHFKIKLRANSLLNCNGLKFGLLFFAFELPECVPIGTGALSTAFLLQDDV